MRKTERKAKSPEHLRNEIKYFYHLSYVKSINEVAPEVSKALKKLTPKCQEFFGKLPIGETYEDK